MPNYRKAVDEDDDPAITQWERDTATNVDSGLHRLRPTAGRK